MSVNDLERRLETLEDRMEEFDRKIFRGNGEPAMAVKIDRLYEWMIRRKSLEKLTAGAAVTAALGVAGNLLWDLWQKQP